MHFLSQFGSNPICVLFRMGRQLLTELLVLDIVFLQRRIHRSRIVHLNPAFDHVLFQTGVIGFLRYQADAMFVLPLSRMIPSCLWPCEYVVVVRTVSRMHSPVVPPHGPASPSHKYGRGEQTKSAIPFAHRGYSSHPFGFWGCFPVSTIAKGKKRLSTHTMDPGRSPCPYRLIDDTGGAFMIGKRQIC